MEYVLEETGFVKAQVKGNFLYKNEKSGHFHKINFIDSFSSFVMESATNYDEAANNLFEDSDLYAAISRIC